jgi:regulator of sigma E protease
VVADTIRTGDLIVSIRINDLQAWPSRDQFIRLIHQAGEEKQSVDLEVRRGDQTITATGLTPSARVGKGKRGLGIALEMAEQNPITAQPMENSPAAKAGIPRGARIFEIDGLPVRDWHDIHRLLAQSSGTSIVRAFLEDGKTISSFALALDDESRQAISRIRYAPGLMGYIQEHIEPRKTSNPILAAGWGVTETRDLLLQFYVTLHRLTQGSVSASNFMGPIGIVYSGSIFAARGTDWLFWFLAMISANLAVVNFLPIPIVDGGLFVFLILEKIQGKPLSERMQTVAQVVGLAIILSVFVLVTYQDIVRFF